MGRKNLGIPVAEGWTLSVHVQAITPDGTQVSLTSHEINGLDNATVDAGAEALVEKIKEQIHAWQEGKKASPNAG